jgi:hypothetical protein
MPGFERHSTEGVFKKIEINGNTLIITLEQYETHVHMIKTSEFCGIVYNGAGAIIHFIHYPSILMKGFSRGGESAKIITKLFGSEITGDLLNL